MPPLDSSPAYDVDQIVAFSRRTRPLATPPRRRRRSRAVLLERTSTKKAAQSGAKRCATATAAAPFNAHRSVYTRTAAAAAKKELPSQYPHAPSQRAEDRLGLTRGVDNTSGSTQHNRKRRRRHPRRLRRRRARPSTNSCATPRGTPKRARARRRGTSKRKEDARRLLYERERRRARRQVTGSIDQRLLARRGLGAGPRSRAFYHYRRRPWL